MEISRFQRPSTTARFRSGCHSLDGITSRLQTGRERAVVGRRLLLLLLGLLPLIAPGLALPDAAGHGAELRTPLHRRIGLNVFGRVADNLAGGGTAGRPA